MLRIQAGLVAVAFLGLSSAHAQTIFPPDGFAVEGCERAPIGPPAATWPYGHYPTMWGRGVPYGFYYTSWTQGICPGAMPMDGFAAPAAGMPAPQGSSSAPAGEQLGAPRPLPSK